MNELILIAAIGFLAPPLSPEESLKTIRLADHELIVELVAAEPDVVSPVAMAWDADGRLFVAEMSDYPNDHSGGRIKLLEDRDGDGRYERSTVFADRLAFPNGVLPWRGGVLVTAAPNIWFFKDADGDGKADHREVVLSGFGTGNQQLRVNGLYWGLDNWIYGANGRSDGDLRWPDGMDAVQLRRKDFRFRPDLKKVEPIAGFSQFGLGHDDWGDRFPSWNTVPWRHVVVEDEALSRLAAVPTTASVADILDPSDGGRVFGIAPPPERFNRESAAYFNATCGTHVFRGSGLGSAYRGDGFVCEPLSNLIHRRKLVPEGSTYRAVRVEANKEFFASTDPWCHPVFLADGPDGALYVADFYRKWVEHPEFTPEPVRKKVDFREGWKHGRIWRIRRREYKSPPKPSFNSAAAADLVNELQSPIGWRRDAAHRLLVERQDRSATSAIEAAGAQSEPETRVQALWTLAGLDSLRDELLRKALGDPHSGVRRNAVRLAAGRSALIAAIRESAADANATVQLAAALALRKDDSSNALPALVQLASRADDDGRRLAIASAVAGRPVAFLRAWSDSSLKMNASEAARRLHHLLATLTGAGGANSEIAAVLQIAHDAPKPVGVALVLGLAEGTARTNQPLGRRRDSLPPESQASLVQFGRWAAETARNQTAETTDRQSAFVLLPAIDPSSAVERALAALGSMDPIDVQRSATRALGSVAEERSLTTALSRWDELPLAVRRELAWACVESEVGGRALLAEIDAKRIPRVEIEPALADLLRSHPKEIVRILAAKVLPTAATNRGAVVAQFRKALELNGDSRRGKEVFARNCRTCHVFRGDGHRVGPDLSGILGRSREAILSDLLDPNKEVSGDYTAVVASLKSGRTTTGVLAGETSASVALIRADGLNESIPRADLEMIRSTGKSLMPEGFERNLTPADVADLLAFLQQPVAK